MQRVFSTILVGVLVLSMSFNPAAAWHFFGGRGGCSLITVRTQWWRVIHPYGAGLLYHLSLAAGVPIRATKDRWAGERHEAHIAGETVPASSARMLMIST